MDEINSKQYAKHEARDKLQHLFNKYVRSTERARGGHISKKPVHNCGVGTFISITCLGMLPKEARVSKHSRLMGISNVYTYIQMH